jgi:hypothetical protein
MNKKLTIWIIGCFCISVGTVVFLFAMSGLMKDRHNSFLRLFPPHPVMEGDTVNIEYNYYIAGGTPFTVYLGNYRAPLRMLVLNTVTLDTQHVRLNVKGIHDQKFWAARVTVDSPYYYLTDGAVPVMFKGTVHDWKAEKYLCDSIYFRDIVPLSPGSFVVKSLSGSTGENILGKITTWPPYQYFTNRILQKQLDGVFCTDGMMLFNKELNRLVYVYYYRNQFMVMDTSLNLLYRANTIDTVSRAKIRTATIESQNTKTLSSPPFFVNRKSSVSGNWLFLNSNLLAKNEHQKAFDQGAVIDVYNLTNGKYEFSFYVYDYWGKKKMLEFRIVGDRMIVLYEKLIRMFDLRPKIFYKARQILSENKNILRAKSGKREPNTCIK